MRAITAGELERMRSTQEGAMPDTRTVKRATNTVSASGGFAAEPATTIATYPCRIMPASAAVIAEYADQLHGRAGWVATFAHDADVRMGDGLTGAAPILDVLGVHAGGGYRTALRAVCVEVLSA
jgi:hypothetical protein